MYANYCVSDLFLCLHKAHSWVTCGCEQVFGWEDWNENVLRTLEDVDWNLLIKLVWQQVLRGIQYSTLNSPEDLAIFPYSKKKVWRISLTFEKSGNFALPAYGGCPGYLEPVLHMNSLATQDAAFCHWGTITQIFPSRRQTNLNISGWAILSETIRS